jgi:hypothetical protein
VLTKGVTELVERLKGKIFLAIYYVNAFWRAILETARTNESELGIERF